MCTKHEGWSNVQTWTVKLWFDNDKALYDKVQAIAELHRERRDLAHCLQELIERHNPLADDDSSLYTDLMTSALDAVDWLEIADDYIAEQQLANFEEWYFHAPSGAVFKVEGSGYTPSELEFGPYDSQDEARVACFLARDYHLHAERFCVPCGDRLLYLALVDFDYVAL